MKNIVFALRVQPCAAWTRAISATTWASVRHMEKGGFEQPFAGNAFVSSTDPSQVKTIADIALYAHGTGQLPAGVEGGLDAQTVYKEA